MNSLPRLLRRKHVQELTGLSSSSLYRKIASGDFPKPVSLGGHAVRWREDELLRWLEERPRAGGEGGG